MSSTLKLMNDIEWDTNNIVKFFFFKLENDMYFYDSGLNLVTVQMPIEGDLFNSVVQTHLKTIINSKLFDDLVSKKLQHPYKTELRPRLTDKVITIKYHPAQ